MTKFEKLFPFVLGFGILLNFNGLLTDILEPDGALYATIAKHIALTGDWINLWGDGHDWLDKPHFPFWMAATSFKIFGINAFAYKLPAFICWLTGIFFTYHLAKELYDKQTAKAAAVIYVFALHGLLSNFDVRAEAYLTGLSAGAIYYVYRFYTSGKWLYVLLASLCSACAVMTKGIFVLITIAGGFIIWWMITKQWKQFVNYRWYVMLLLIVLFTMPEIYCLYMQFDVHPEKVVFGKTNVSGIRFFLWDSQFGRFFNTGPIKGRGEPSFFLHTTLWAFLPWSVLLYCAAVKLIHRKKLTEDINDARWIIYGSALVTFIMFSLSRFQLPHYIVILFPQFSIITAAYVFSIKNVFTLRKIKIAQQVLLLLAIALVCLLSWYSKTGYSVLLIVIMLIVALTTIFYKNPANSVAVIAYGVVMSSILFLFLFNFFYPHLLTYQAGMMAGKWLKKNEPGAPPALLNTASYSWEFYASGYVETINGMQQTDSFLIKNPEAVFFTSQHEADKLRSEGYNVQTLACHPYFHVTMLDTKFLNFSTRKEVLDTMCVIRLKRR